MRYVDSLLNISYTQEDTKGYSISGFGKYHIIGKMENKDGTRKEINCYELKREQLKLYHCLLLRLILVNIPFLLINQYYNNKM